MKYKIRSYSGKRIKAAAKLAYKCHMGINGGLMLPTLRDLANGEDYYNGSKKILVLAFDKNKPVGIALAITANEIWVYTKPPYRKQGIGRAMYRRAIRRMGKKRNFKVHFTPQGTKFFQKVLTEYHWK